MEDQYENSDVVVDEATKSLKVAVDHWNPIFEESKADIAFLSDTPGAQWDPKDYTARLKKRLPTLTIDQLGQYVNKVSNDIRMNTPTINVIPTGGNSDPWTAEIIKGLVRDIEQKSNADAAYDNACAFAIEGSIGFFRVNHSYINIDSFEQEMTIDRVINPHLIFLDPESTEPDGSDALVAHIVEPMTIEAFEKRWPGKEPVGIDCSSLPPLGDKEIYVMEYFKIELTPATLYRLRDGTEGVMEGEPDPETMFDVAMSRPTEIRDVVRCWLSGAEKLETTTCPGEYIPIIPVYGKEAWEDGKRRLESLIRKSKDAQRSFNYWKSMEMELLMKQPKAPVVAPAGSIEPYAEAYINPDGTQVLLYEPYDEQGRALPPPSFGNVPRMPDGPMVAARNSVDDIKSTMGMYGASLGQRSNETSGTAIAERKQEGDQATFHFGDNLLRSIQHAGRIIVTSIPEIYNAPRIVSVIGKEDTSEMLGINGALVEGQQQTVDLTKGGYSVTVTTGAPFATMRQEAAEFFKQIVMTTPELMQTMGDLVFKYMDFPGSQAVSDRLRKLMPPHLTGENPQEGPTPEQQQIAEMEQAMQQMQQQTAQLEQQLKDKTQEVQIKAQTEMAKNDTEKQKQQVEVMRLSLEQEKIKAELAIQQQELNVKREEIDLKRQELGFKLAGTAPTGNGQPNF